MPENRLTELLECWSIGSFGEEVCEVVCSVDLEEFNRPLLQIISHSMEPNVDMPCLRSGGLVVGDADAGGIVFKNLRWRLRESDLFK